MEYSLGKTLLEVKNICLDYDGKSILRDVNISVKDIIRPNTTTGQIVGFLGPSGIGKTQLFRIIAGLNKAKSGEVIINGDKPVVAGDVGVVAQKYPLFNHRTVLSNLMLSASKKEPNSQAAKDRVLTYLELFQLSDKKNLYPAQLSGGQKQRVAIIQQILSSEHFLLMDEPFSGLDLIMLEKTCDLLGKVANMHEFNTIIVVTHDVNAAAAVSDHIWMMGRERDQQGNFIQGAKIMKEYNLIEKDLCWHPGITKSQRFTDFVNIVKEDFRFM